MCDNAEMHCKHFVARKKRYCRMTLKRGDEYCGEHQPQVASTDGTNANKTTRIACPLDSTHTCFANKLKQHLKKCNNRPTVLPPYIHKNFNTIDGNNATPKREKLFTKSVDVLLQVIDKVNKMHTEVINKIDEKFLSHPILEDALSNPQNGELTKKDLKQASAILGLVQEYNLFKPDTCFIEFGAGKGKVAYWVAKVLEDLQHTSSSVLLVERASLRHKQDNKLDKSNGNVQRIKADIADLILSKVDAVNKAKAIVGITKHLCGVALDLAIECLLNCEADKKEISGLVMSICCHHRCQWSSFTGRKFFEELGLTESDFDTMCCLVGWAVCGTGQSREAIQNNDRVPEQNARSLEIGLTRDQKAEIGRKCKNLLNWGRKRYLMEHGFRASLCYYVDADVSLENVCLIGVKSSDGITNVL